MVVDCPELTTASRCTAHTRKPFEGLSTAHRRLRGRPLQRRNARILSRDGHICHLCMGEGASVVDHITPLARGGTDEDSNLRAAHAACNQRKGAR